MHINIFSFLFLFIAEISPFPEPPEKVSNSLFPRSQKQHCIEEIIFTPSCSISSSSSKALISLQQSVIFSSLSLYHSAKNYSTLKLETKKGSETNKNNLSNQVHLDRLIILGLLIIGASFTAFFLWRLQFYKQKQFLTDKLKHQNELITTQNELISKRNKELSELDQHKNKLFSILSHDLKSPLAAIQQLLELMKSEEFSQEELTTLLDEMLLQVSATSTMLKNLLHWASSQMEGANLTIERLQLPIHVSKVIDAYGLVAKSKNIKILHHNPELIEDIYIDKAHLSIILQNVISNAIKFSPLNETINVFYKDTSDRVKLIVEDNGQGMSSERIAQIKNAKNKMISEVGTKMEIGTGLGMLVVNQFLSMNRATLDIESILGKGSRFIIGFQKKSF